MLEDNSGKMIWTVGAIAIAVLIIVAAKTFFPDLFTTIQDKINEQF